MKDMILVTGGTGFIGQALIRQLITNGYEVRTLVRPGKASPRLPRGIPLDVVVSSLADERGVLAAMKDVDQIYHLVTGEYQGSGVNLLSSDIQSTQVVVKAALESGIKHLIYVSHLGSDRASAYPVLKSKGIAENIIKTSGVPYTILRSGRPSHRRAAVHITGVQVFLYAAGWRRDPFATDLDRRPGQRNDLDIGRS
jgi:NADH dehydrogenase